MDVELAVMLGKELTRLGADLMSKHLEAQLAGNEEVATMALAKVVFYTKVLERYQENDDYYTFVIDMQVAREVQEDFYYESRAANDRKRALVALARLRFLAMLQRRLAAAERDKAMETLRNTPSIVRH
ncbi:hypothetical protein [Geomonas subterranea]|uniref:Uncharacterized protein n=1 Tax=Geomonas subterranea TaxID=2847989 RepID=A0ABX8LC20_9BACT|nr:MULTISPECIES: hypothetical protein [Geomonas]QXE89568.1 hypothetical protein KP001_14105 [Geomonas subterranea]QXM08315.1 hypothetical protein KP002_15170 [Geomonas subterranea]